MKKRTTRAGHPLCLKTRPLVRRKPARTARNPVRKVGIPTSFWRRRWQKNLGIDRKAADLVRAIEQVDQVFTEYRDDPEGAIKRLLKEKAGEARAVVTREGLGEIDLVYGNEKGGLRHIAENHPEILPRLPAILRNELAAYAIKEYECAPRSLPQGGGKVGAGFHRRCAGLPDGAWVRGQEPDDHKGRSVFCPQSSVF